MQNSAGSYKKQLNGKMQYKSFLPTPLQNIILDTPDDETLSLLAQAQRSLGILDGVSSNVPNIDLFISMYIRKEALLSSQIEGTQATLDDILDPAAQANQNVNVADVLNYIKAINFALERMNTLPLCNRLLKETHEVLLSGIRGSEKNPGEFRQSQNWIGGAGSVINNASYVPPSPEDMLQAMGDLEDYLNAESNLDLLMKASLIHYQFETIHPFLDGNGRIGRLLFTLFLCDKKVLSRPALYISYYLKLNRVEYYDRLMEVRRTGNYEQWIKFFVRAIAESAKDAVETINKLSALRQINTEKIATLGRLAQSAKKLYNYIELSPIIEINKTSKELGLSFNTVAKAVENLCLLGILRQTDSGSRNRTFAYEDYVAILRKDT